MCEDITSSRARVDGFGGGDGMARGPEEREAVGITRCRGAVGRGGGSVGGALDGRWSGLGSRKMR